jgi:hypothetical protein
MTLYIAQRDGLFDIMCDSHGMKAIAGPRLFRAPPHPDIKFTGHPTRDQAAKDCEKLWRYLDNLPDKKPSKAKQRAAEREVYQ